MAFDLHPDSMAAASHRNMIAHLCGPFAFGAIDTNLAVQPNGTIRVRSAREPVLLLAPKTALGDQFLRVSAVLDPAGAAAPISPPLVFGPYTEAGAFLPLHSPGVNQELRTAAPFTVKLTLELVDRDGNVLPAPADASQRVEAALVEGVMGKIILLMGSEKARLRRQAREIAAVRALSNARGETLDRLGADLGVPRFADRLAFDAARNEIIGETILKNGQPAAEDDVAYRRRLRVYQSWLMPTPKVLSQLLNGAPPPPAANTGVLGQLGFPDRVVLNETNNDFAVSVHMVAPGAPDLLKNFQDCIANHLLIWPTNIPANNTRHSQRFLSTAEKKRVTELRGRLRQAFGFGNNMAIAPALALALDRVGRLRQALAAAAAITVKRAFDPVAGSRYELGMGVDIAPIKPADLDAMHAVLTGPNPVAAPDPEIGALARSLRSRPSAEDPEGKWLLEACGLRTVHRVNATTIYLSHLPTFGLVVSEPPNQQPSTPLQLEARYHAPGDPGANVMLEAALVNGAKKWTAAGREAFTRITDAQARTRWTANPPQPAAVQNIFRAAGLPVVADVSKIVPALNTLPGELFEAIQLGPALTAQILGGQPAAADTLRALADLFRGEKLSSILPFASGANQITVLLGAIGLPQAGINLAERIATGFRWYAVPIQGKGGALKTSGSRSAFRTDGAGLTAIVVLGYARVGLVDPYEFRVEIPDPALLNLEQYEFLMNLLERACPLGVQANTFNIRQRHVDLNGDGKAEPMPPSVFRTYRKFQRRRQRGEIGVGVAGTP